MSKSPDKKQYEKPEIVFPWTKEQEELLAEWSEKATCYRWLHSRSEKSYRGKNYLFTIPVIILSTLTGTANFAMDSFVPEEHKQIAMAAVGSVNIFAGILSTLQNFLRYAELMEAHRLSEVQWSKFGRNIAVELALDPKRRKSAHDFLKVSRAEYDRLIEQSPTIDDNVIRQFKKTFKNTDIRVPDTCNGLHPCKIYERSEEEKMEDIVVSAGKRLLENKKVRKWTINDVNNKTKELPLEGTAKHSHSKHESKKELDELHSFSRVSAFHEKIKQNKETKETTPAEEIKQIVNSVKENIQETVVDTALDEVIEEAPEDSVVTEDIEQGNNQQTQTDTQPTPEPEPETITEEQEFLDGITEDTSQP
uniref:SMODS and SLOG-associating 2TM effector domain-containing protein n=1 Tax=viral metagenome TaxID=1070528 RepID=A0A6C0F7I8_9ZZZZ|tara:strand:- start:6177 stop:7268 length:1092 start_codon:yes stop_codon:yes gene_type:complete